MPHPPAAGAGGPAGERAPAERFAAGEIDEAEYRARRAVLRAEQ
ncbi:SHOCT domain-containing protein [uncultured Georgenia sp.]|nr:SHOCT domain-containing protein [uncultured Georgenia sp.]HLV04488.1 SHOCT domain-containing protein [Actinomycetaceae bacterium]